MEIWKDIQGYEGLYQVSDLGRVKSLARTVYRKGFKGVDSWKPVGERILVQTLSNHGYPAVNLAKAGVRSTHKVHRLVALHFLGPCPEGQEVRHRDANRANPTLTNLEYGTRKENCADAIRHGQMIGASNGNSKLKEDDVRMIRKLSNVCADHLGLRFGVTAGTVRNIWAGRTYRSVA